MEIRRPRPDELAFVREATARNKPWPRGWTFDDWHHGIGAIVDRWLTTGLCLVVEADVVLAFAIGYEGKLRELYVKRDFRGHGLDGQLASAMREAGYVW